jgi:hypothetical protein
MRAIAFAREHRHPLQCVIELKFVRRLLYFCEVAADTV